MRFDDRVTGNLATYAKQAKIIHFDIDPAEINKNVKVDVAVLGNCKDTLRAVTDLLVPAKHKEWLASFAPLCRRGACQSYRARNTPRPRTSQHG